ncbi:MAG: MFS transporter [Bdellovibrionota bacterium]|nr:MFS transporter [Bdellovibrionota bacterium]
MKPETTAFKEKHIILVLAALQFAHILDFVILMPLGPFLMKQFQISPIQFGSLVSSYNIAGGISGLLFGALADSFPKKKVLIWTTFGFILGTALCGFAEDFYFLFLARIITGVFGGILNALILIFVTEIIPYKRRGKALGVVMSSFSFASVIGVPSGLFIAELIGTPWTFFSISLLSLMILLLAGYILPSIPMAFKKRKPREVLKRYFSISLHPPYLNGYLLIFTAAFTMFILIPYLAPYAVKNCLIPTSGMKYMYFFGGVATIFTARLFGKLTDNKGPLKMYIFLAIVSIIPVVIYTHAGPMDQVSYILMGTLFMTIVTGRMIPCITLISSLPDDRDRGTFLVLLNSFRSLGSALATFIGGLIIVEENNRFLHFEKSGYLSIILLLLSLFLAIKINRKKNNKKENIQELLN